MRAREIHLDYGMIGRGGHEQLPTRVIYGAAQKITPLMALNNVVYDAAIYG